MASIQGYFQGWADTFTDMLKVTIKVVPGKGSSYRMSQAEGESNLVNLAKTAQKEDAWMFYNSLWMDIGYTEGPHQVRICDDESFHIVRSKSGELRVEQQSLEDLLVFAPDETCSIKEFFIYHIHRNFDGQLPPGDYRSPPSPTDICFHAILHTYFKDKKPSMAYHSRIADSKGIWEFRTTPQLAERILLACEEDIEDVLAELSRPYREMGIVLSKNQDAPYDLLLNRAILGISELGVQIKYRPISSQTKTI